VPDAQALALRRVNASAERLARTLELLES